MIFLTATSHLEKNILNKNLVDKNVCYEYLYDYYGVKDAYKEEAYIFFQQYTNLILNYFTHAMCEKFSGSSNAFTIRANNIEELKHKISFHKNKYFLVYELGFAVNKYYIRVFEIINTSCSVILNNIIRGKIIDEILIDL